MEECLEGDDVARLSPAAAGRSHHQIAYEKNSREARGNVGPFTEPACGLNEIEGPPVTP